jgi:hypothetical protein
MRARDVAAGENHHHKGRANCERRDHTGACADPGATNCQNEEESSDEFRDVFVHG